MHFLIRRNRIHPVGRVEAARAAVHAGVYGVKNVGAGVGVAFAVAFAVDDAAPPAPPPGLAVLNGGHFRIYCGTIDAPGSS